MDDIVEQLQSWKLGEGASDDAVRKDWLMKQAADVENFRHADALLQSSPSKEEGKA